jgi:hypothetical protein
VKVHLELDGERREAAEQPVPDADHVVVAGACPFKVGGVAGTMSHGHDTYRADAGCLSCLKVLGRLVVVVSTIFGVEEDRAVLVDGRARVY